MRTGSVLTRFGERGQVLTITALMLVFLLGMAGVAADTALVLSERTKMQRAADAAALAGASALPDAALGKSRAAVLAEANGYTNGYVSVTSVTPYKGDQKKIEVTIKGEVNLTFLRVIGLKTASVSARAVGESAGGALPYALFATNTACPGNDTLEVAGSGSNITGEVFSNGLLKIPGSNNIFNGPVRYACNIQNSGSGNTFSSAPQKVSTEASPFSYLFQDFPCTVTFTQDTDLKSVNSVWKNNNPSSKELKDGVYCSTKKLTLSESGVKGNVTLVALGTISVSGGNFNLKAYWQDILLYTYSTDSSAMDISASGGTWTGLLLAPRGKAKMQGSSSFTITGAVIADRVYISGSNFNLAAGGNTAVAKLRLSE